MHRITSLLPSQQNVILEYEAIAHKDSNRTKQKEVQLMYTVWICILKQKNEFTDLPAF